ncbi:hypothetical protein BGX28_000428, partial [Mortierella sp. GBA30]
RRPRRCCCRHGIISIRHAQDPLAVQDRVCCIWRVAWRLLGDDQRRRRKRTRCR